MVVATYLRCWRVNYRINPNKQSDVVERDHSFIGDTQLTLLQSYALDLATRLRLSDEPFDGALERALLLFFRAWLARKGKGNCLVEAQHPLHMLSERDIKEHFAQIYAKGSPVFGGKEPPANSEKEEQSNHFTTRDALDFAKKLPGNPTDTIPKRAA